MDSLTKRFCPKCGQSVKGKLTAFDNRLNCPKCRQNVFFYDYPNADLPEAPNEYQSSSGVILVSLAVCLGILLILTILGLLFGSNNFVIAFMFVTFALAIGATALAAMKHDRAGKLEHYCEHYEFAIQSLHEAVELANGFKKNHENALEDELRKARDEYARAALHAEAVRTISEKFVDETLKWSLKNVTPNNYHQIWKRLERNIDWCRKRGGEITALAVDEAKEELADAYAHAIRKAEAKEEQRIIREQMREEARVEREMKRALQEAENRELAIKRAIEEAMNKAQGEHTEELDRLRQQLAEAHSATERTKSMAQMTRAGHVYVISNIGSFGEGMFKVGMTRRLEPMDRVVELGDASVPFPFDVHAMISSDDAPALENALHRSLENYRVNRVNLRREFFRVSLKTIIAEVESNHGTVDYVAEPEALQYRESIAMTEESVFAKTS